MKKPNSTLILLLFLALTAAFLGYNYYFRPFYSVQEATQMLDNTQIENATASAGVNAIETIFNRFSQQDKIGQVISWPVSINTEGEVEKSGELTSQELLILLGKRRPGLITIFGTQISSDSARTAINTLKGQTSGVLPVWIGVDHEGGKVQRLNGDGFTKLTSWNNICGLDKKIAAQTLTKSAIELKNVGVNVVFAPVIDVGLPRGSLSDRLCSSNPELVVDRVSIFNKIFKEQGMLPVLKHFPGIGKVFTDLHFKFAVTRVGVEDVFVYRSVLDDDSALGVMTTHVGLENQYANIPCSLSPDCVGELTTNYPEPLIFADALEMKSAAYLPVSSQSAEKKELDLAEVSLKALAAGNDVLLFGKGVTPQQMDLVYDMLNKAYTTDDLFRERIDQSVKKIIGYKLGITQHAIETTTVEPE